MTRVYGKFTIVSGGLQPGSQPIEDVIGAIDNVGDRRRLYCRRYENCLTYAASLNWAGFHCDACPINEITHKD